MGVWQPGNVCINVSLQRVFTGRRTYVSVSLPHFPLIDLHHVEQEADSNLHVCECNYHQQWARSVGPQYSWWCWISMLRSQHWCWYQTSIWLYQQKATPISTLHLIRSQRCRLDLASLRPPHIQNTLFLNVMCFSLDGVCLTESQKCGALSYSLIWDLLNHILTWVVLQLNACSKCNSRISPADGRKYTCVLSHIYLQPASDVGRAVDL